MQEKDKEYSEQMPRAVDEDRVSRGAIDERMQDGISANERNF